MIFENKMTRNTTTFSELSVGDVFTYEDDVYLVVPHLEVVGHPYLHDGNSIILDSGNLCYFDEDEQVIKIKATLVLEDL